MKNQATDTFYKLTLLALHVKRSDDGQKIIFQGIRQVCHQSKNDSFKVAIQRYINYICAGCIT